MTRLVIWKSPFADFIKQSLRREGFLPDSVSVASWQDCEKQLIDGRADLALIPTLRAIKIASDFQVLPAVAISSWDYPFTRIVLPEGLDKPVKNVRYTEESEQERILARIILGEHYGLRPTFVGPEPESAAAQSGDARLVSGDETNRSTHDLVLDIGREWFELANYPMVWGLFVSLKGLDCSEDVKLLRKWVRNVETHRETQIETFVPEDHHREFFREQLRFRLDDLATASLTEFRQFLYYYDVMDEIPELQFADIKEEEDNEPAPLL